MQDVPTRKSSKTAVSAAILAVLPVIYVLSAGPVGCVLEQSVWCRRRPRLKNAVYSVYMPLRPLFEHESLGPPFRRYLEWWDELAKEPRMVPDPFVPSAQGTADPFGQLPSTSADQDPK